jgi:hypothetical protein
VVVERIGVEAPTEHAACLLVGLLAPRVEPRVVATKTSGYEVRARVGGRGGSIVPEVMHAAEEWLALVGTARTRVRVDGQSYFVSSRPAV